MNRFCTALACFGFNLSQYPGLEAQAMRIAATAPRHARMPVPIPAPIIAWCAHCAGLYVAPEWDTKTLRDRAMLAYRNRTSKRRIKCPVI
jgi:hypothetical protein